MEADTTTTVHERLAAERAERARAQEAINTLMADHGPGAAELACRLRAQLDHAGYPQYDGRYTDGTRGVWRLARVTCRIDGKGGIGAERGDVVLCRHESYGVCPGITTIYSVRTGWEWQVGFGVEWWKQPTAGGWTLQAATR